MNKIASIILLLGILVSGSILFFGGKNQPQESPNNVETKNGVQYITITAKGGYSPQTSTAKSGIPTKLVVKTNGTYDCSASLVIKSLGYQKILPQTGEEIIDLGTPKPGTSIQGLCGMGMYNFLVKFE